jgi:hypothetical protein
MAARTLLLIVVVLFTSLSGAAAEPILFDTDIGGDIDDAGTMAVMHAYVNDFDAARAEITALMMHLPPAAAIRQPQQ